MKAGEYSEEKPYSVEVIDFNNQDLRDSDVFAAFYDEYAPKLLRHAYFRTGSEEDAKDIVAQVFLQIWEYLRNPENHIAEARPFLYKVANNLIIDFYRRRARWQPLFYEDHQASLAADYGYQPQDKVQAKRELELIWAKTKNLPEHYRTVLLWRYVDELTVSEIAFLLGKSKGATSVLIWRALRAFQKVVKQINKNK